MGWRLYVAISIGGHISAGFAMAISDLAEVKVVKSISDTVSPFPKASAV